MPFWRTRYQKWNENVTIRRGAVGEWKPRGRGPEQIWFDAVEEDLENWRETVEMETVGKLYTAMVTRTHGWRDDVLEFRICTVFEIKPISNLLETLWNNLTRWTIRYNKRDLHRIHSYIRLRRKSMIQFQNYWVKSKF